jgi:hypothetical protein
VAEFVRGGLDDFPHPDIPTADTCHDRGFMTFEWCMSDTCHGVGHGVAQALLKVFVPLSVWEYPAITGFSPTVLNSVTPFLSMAEQFVFEQG